MSNLSLKSIKKGEILSTTIYAEVLSVDTDGVKVRDSSGREYEIRGQKLIEDSMNSASQFSNTEKVSKTEMVQTLLTAGDSAFTVKFTKADGKERTLVGYLLSTENLLGRSNVIDLQVKSGSNLRQVDHRTIEELILKGTKYILK